MDTLIIRKISKRDVPEVVLLFDEQDPMYIQVAPVTESLINVKNRKHTYIALYKKKIVGFVYGAVLLETTLMPQFMYVRPEYRRRGIGRLLMQKLESESGCSSSIIYYNKELRKYYASQKYVHGSELEVAVKPLGGDDL